MIPPGRPTPEAAFGFGADLARLHAAGAAGFGAPWPGFIASLPLDNTPLPDAAGDWPQWYAQRRLLPFLRRAVDAGALGPDDARLVEAVIDRIGSLAGPAEPPSRIHGDCWAGNVLWSGGRGWLIDPAAHGGHRETDLAMLALFGAPGPGPDPGRLQRGGPAGGGLAVQDPAAPAASRCWCTRACSAPPTAEEVRSAARAVLACPAPAASLDVIGPRRACSPTPAPGPPLRPDRPAAVGPAAHLIRARAGHRSLSGAPCPGPAAG